MRMMTKGNANQMTLTKGEMDIMRRLWSIGKAASIKDILEICDAPKPAYTTVATFLKILTAKGFLLEEKRPKAGKTLFYSPIISQEAYTRRVMDDVTSTFFGGSVKSLVHFFVQEEKIDAAQINELLKLIER